MDKQPKCFVPECNSDVGVLFPKNPIVRKKWLTSLGLDHLNLEIIDSKTFLCLDHFEEDGQPGGLPKPVSSQVPSSNEVPDKITSVGSNRPITRYTSYQADVQKRIDSAVEIQALKREVIAKTRAGSKLTKQEERSQDNEVQRPYNNMCRLCMSYSPKTLESINNKADGKHTIAHMITVCLNPLQVSPSDKLSKFICAKCLGSLKEYFKFHQFCLGMDAKQKELILLEQEYHSDGHYPDSDNSDEYLHEERLSDYEENKENKDESRSEKTNGLTIKRFLPNQEKKSNEQKLSKKSEIDLKFDKVEEELARVLEGGKYTSNSEPENISQLEEPNNSYQTKAAETSVTDTIDQCKSRSKPSPKKSISVQVKGKDEEIYTENIIIEMVNDEESQQSQRSIKLPITIKRISSSDTSKKKPIKRKRSSSTSLNNDHNVTMIRSDGGEEVVVLPKGIKVEVREKYHSPLGVYPCETVKYLFHTEYLLADGYLYEYWLSKSDVRNLHCVVPRCPAIATQARINYTTFSDQIEVVKAHNHEAPDLSERKRQMFYNIMYSKMKKDRNFNFKILYEQLCKMDQDLSDILPLRKVISEICKQGPVAVQPPVMNCFDEFYASIDSDAFHKIHFTDNYVQFYQGKYETDEGAKAVVFANPQVVNLYSDSKLMYVDASFYIESNDFPYKLVTVLVWIYESYYPILFAFVNQKSLELYKQIFSFLYNTLGPNLRPDEIITDYEANLYYALGETYVNSSIGLFQPAIVDRSRTVFSPPLHSVNYVTRPTFAERRIKFCLAFGLETVHGLGVGTKLLREYDDLGGSMFYFTQNLYKKICALDLSKELDLNSNFRSIYNMLLMLPLLPVNTILDGLNNIEVQAKELELEELTNELFIHVHNEWICSVTPEFFCVHRLENRINENIVAPFKKLRDLIMLTRNRPAKMLSIASIVHVIEKIIELEKYLRYTYSGPAKAAFSKDLSSSQKKIVLKAWNFIENHPKININHFYLKVLGYIKCLENQLWIWGFYRFEGDAHDDLINASNFSIVNETNHDLEEQEYQEDAPTEEMGEEDALERQEDHDGEEEEDEEVIEEFFVEDGGAIRRVCAKSGKALLEEFSDEQQNAKIQETEPPAEKEQPAVLMEAVLDENGSFVLQNTTNTTRTSSIDNNFLMYK